MKRLAVVAVMLAWMCCAALAQRGGARGGFSGSHAGFSGGGFSSHSATTFQGGFSAPRGGFLPPASSRYPGLARVAPRASLYSMSGPRPVGGPRVPSSYQPRTPYHSSNGSYHHNGYTYSHNHVVVVSGYTPYCCWNYPYRYGYPYYGWGYPYLWPSIFNDSDNYDSQPSSNYAAPPAAYQAPAQDEITQDAREPYAPEPEISRRAPYGGGQSLPATTEAPITTIVLKDGSSEQIHNYMLTAKTLTVLDQRRREIPVEQIDLEATAKVNLQQGVEFSLPGQE